MAGISESARVVSGLLSHEPGDDPEQDNHRQDEHAPEDGRRDRAGGRRGRRLLGAGRDLMGRSADEPRGQQREIVARRREVPLAVEQQARRFAVAEEAEPIGRQQQSRRRERQRLVVALVDDHEQVRRVGRIDVDHERRRRRVGVGVRPAATRDRPRHRRAPGVALPRLGHHDQLAVEHAGRRLEDEARMGQRRVRQRETVVAARAGHPLVGDGRPARRCRGRERRQRHGQRLVEFLDQVRNLPARRRRDPNVFEAATARVRKGRGVERESLESDGTRGNLARHAEG